MEGWHWGLILKPVVLLAFFLAVAVIAQVLKYFLPDGPLKDLLYDRTHRKRHPVAWTLLIIGFYIAFLASIGLFISSSGN